MVQSPIFKDRNPCSKPMTKKETVNSRSYAPRDLDTRETKQSFLIVCEGTKTEPKYFKSFRVPVRAEGVAKDPSGLVDCAKVLAKEDRYDQVWRVFDRDPGTDSWTAENFNSALHKAEALGFKVAYSNECFEIWYILHFEYLNTGLPRDDYGRKLRGHLKQKYKKNDPDMYNKILDKQPMAIKFAKKLLASYDPHNPEQDNPCTTVHLLVEALNAEQS
jgi:RloB-like protein